jgi:PAS domain S-box-containing protein
MPDNSMSTGGDSSTLDSYAQLHESDTHFHRLLEKLPAGAYTCDRQGLITYYNPHAETLWGRAPKLNDPADRFCGSFKLYAVDGTPIAHDRCWMALALEENCGYNAREIVIERPSGERVTALAHANPIHDSMGVLLGAVNVLVDISDRKIFEDGLRDADRAKSEFLATMSHEIRTPLNAIVGYVDLLDVEVAGPLTEGQRFQLGRIRGASQHLMSLITDVLDLSKIEAGQMVLRCEPRRAGDSAESAIAVVHPLAAAKGIALRNRCRANGAIVYHGDEDRVRQMLINLLTNAIKFTDAGGRVELDCSVEERAGGQVVHFRVIDTGIGIASDQLECVFEPFVQAESSRTRTRGGSGLGLTITLRLARLMGGDLTVESVLGAGSVFSLWLPVSDEGVMREVGAHSESATRSEHATAPELFAAAGHALLANMDAIVRGYVERLRREGVGPGAQLLPRAQLASHAATLVSDIAVMLLALDEGEVGPSFSTSSDVQRVCAIEHGRQRAGIGWNDEALARDYDALFEEIIGRLRDLGSPGDRLVETVMSAIRARLGQAKVYSERGLRSASD